jgi:hypothetical protein
MVEIGVQTDFGKLSPKDFVEKCLGYRFPAFDDFRKELKNRLGGVILTIIKKKEENEHGVRETDWVKMKEGLTYFSSEFG